MFYKSRRQNDPDANPAEKYVNMTLQPIDALDKLNEISKERKFKESVEAIVKLNVDPTKGDQMIRGTCILPAGTGKEIKVCVFADAEFHKELIEAGADIIGDESIIQKIADGEVPFDKIICTSEQIPILKKYARVLGPKGLMPNTKSGTLVKPDMIVETVR
jgi:large subunit ribosomal protein L1